MEQPQNIADQLQSIRNDLTLISLQDKSQEKKSDSGKQKRSQSKS